MSSGRESCSPRLIGDRLLRDRRDEKRASIRMRNCRRMPTKGGGSPTEVANLATGAAPQEAVFSGGRAARANFDQIGTASLRGAGGRRSNLECCSGGEAGSGSHATLRWRKADSNPRSRRGKSGRSERCGINPRSFGPRERHQVRRGTNGSNPACSSGESAANLNFGGEARVAGSGPDRRVLRRGLDWLAVLVVYCFGLGGLVFLS